MYEVMRFCAIPLNLYFIWNNLFGDIAQNIRAFLSKSGRYAVFT